MSLAKEREKRANAGSRMARLLNEEEDAGDAFYSNLYGGLQDEAQDNDYEKESSEDDEVDSDFDIDEADAGANVAEDAGEGHTANAKVNGEAGPVPSQQRQVRKRRVTGSEDEDDDTKQRYSRRKYRIFTKAYKEPVRSKTSTAPSKSSPTDANGPASATSTSVKLIPVKVGRFEPRPSSTDLSVRAAAQQASMAVRATRKRRATAAAMASTIAVKTVGKKRGPRPGGRLAHSAEEAPQMRRLTQEELLEEAKLTEQINLRSLAQYQRMEIERKRVRSVKRQTRGPSVRFHSLAVPVVAMVPPITVASVNDDGSSQIATAHPPVAEMNERTFITFPNEAVYRASFPQSAHLDIGPMRGATVEGGTPSTKTAFGTALHRQRFCPITGQPARYMDPLTKVGYADGNAFRVLRHLYRLHLQTGEKAIQLVRKFRAGQIEVPGVNMMATVVAQPPAGQTPLALAV